jgi:hypothetical protein
MWIGFLGFPEAWYGLVVAKVTSGPGRTSTVIPFVRDLYFDLDLIMFDRV